MLMYGPPGVGKSSAVFACAAMHGFEVIEVNSSMVRSGAAIKDLFLEATQSRHVDFSALGAAKQSGGAASIFGGGGKAKAKGKDKKKEKGKAAGKDKKLSLILFEEVDQVFDELDPGFFPALKTLTRSAKVN